MEGMPSAQYSMQRSRSRSLTIYIAVLGVLSAVTFIFALYNLMGMKNIQVQLKVLGETVTEDEKPPRFASESNAPEAPVSLIKAKESLESAKDPAQSRKRRASSYKSKKQHRNSLPGLSGRMGKKKSSGATFTFDKENKELCDVVNNLVQPPRGISLKGWDMNCWTSNIDVNFASSKPHDNAIVVSKDGVYFLYSMLTFIVKEKECHDPTSSIGYSVMEATSQISLLRCVEYATCTNEFRVSCYAGRVVRLEKHKRLSVKIHGDLESVASVLANTESTYVGLIRLHGK